ncbi:MAG: hemerythrin domain-containing protein [Magnetococcales bacterium]|nr:hemerythrin domain-containing protein [Magnetococcales bacterium]
MTTLSAFLTNDHRRCDALYAQMEQIANQGDLENTRALFGQFHQGLERHFHMEEDVFFPAFEQRTGMTQGPTTVMRMEHRQMRGILTQMASALEQGDTGAVARACSTLLILMQQHNAKEEQMLYPMGDMHLGAEAAALCRTMQGL